jgi:hypothetical protein
MLAENTRIREAMKQDESKGKSTRSIKLPRISPVARLILIIGIFLVIAIPLYLTLSQQQVRKAELVQQYSMLEKALGKPEPVDFLKNELDTDIAKAKKELTNIKTVFPNADQSPEIIDDLMALARENDIEITKALIATESGELKVGTDVMKYPVSNFDISLKGQVPKFQNFLWELNSKFPTSKIEKVYFRIPEKVDEEDTANIVLSVFNNQGAQSAIGEISTTGKKPAATITDKKDKITDPFKIKGSQWRIDWKVTTTDTKWAGLSLAVYRKGETGRYVELISRTITKTEGTDYVRQGDGEYYIQVFTANVSNWEIKIYE